MSKVNPFRLKAPCSNCPFLKEGAIELEPGRLTGIIELLVEDDHNNFQCHKTVHSRKTGGTWSDDGSYLPSGNESMCAGAMAYLEKIGRPTVGMRIGIVLGLYDPEVTKQYSDKIIDPI